MNGAIRLATPTSFPRFRSAMSLRAVRFLDVVSDMDLRRPLPSCQGSQSGIASYTCLYMSMRRANNLSSIAVALFAVTIAAPPGLAQSLNSFLTPDWCRQLPRPKYKQLERVPSVDPWFEVYRIAPGVFAIYE